MSFNDRGCSSSDQAFVNNNSMLSVMGQVEIVVNGASYLMQLGSKEGKVLINIYLVSDRVTWQPEVLR